MLHDPFVKVEPEPPNPKNPLVADGDVFIFKLKEEDPSRDDAFTDTRAIPKIDPRKSTSVDGDVRTGKGRARAPEQGIKIEVNFS